MKNHKVKILLVLTLIVNLLSISLQPVIASQNYKITYSPGAKGVFDQSLIKEYEAVYGDENVVVFDKTGSITITVEKEAAMPRIPTAEDIIISDTNYYVRAGDWEPTSTVVSKSDSFVVKYNMLNHGKEYTIQFIDSSTGEEIASPIISIANVNDTITYTAKNIDGYKFDALRKSMVVTNDAKDNIIQFAYTGNKDRNVVINTVNETIINRTMRTPIVSPIITYNSKKEKDQIDHSQKDDVQKDEQKVTSKKDGKVDDLDPKSKSKDSSKAMDYIPFIVCGLVIVVTVGYILVKKKVQEES